MIQDRKKQDRGCEWTHGEPTALERFWVTFWTSRCGQPVFTKHWYCLPDCMVSHSICNAMWTPNLGPHTVQTIACTKTVRGKFCDENILLTFGSRDARKFDIVFPREKVSFMFQKIQYYLSWISIQKVKLFPMIIKGPELPICTYCHQVFQYGK